MQLQKLKNGKFQKNVLSDTAMKMLDGGKTFPTGNNNSDSIVYSCCGEKGDLYDRTWNGSNGQSLTETNLKMWEGTDASWYE